VAALPCRGPALAVPDVRLRVIPPEKVDTVVALLLEHHVLLTGWPRIFQYLEATGQLARARRGEAIPAGEHHQERQAGRVTCTAHCREWRHSIPASRRRVTMTMEHPI
jgi:hypothetical protein